MEENVNDALGILPAENSVTPQTTEQNADNNNAENTLSTIAMIILIVGISAAVVCLLSLTTIDGEFNPAGLGLSVLILLSTLISYSIMTVLANISLTLKDINKKIE